MAPSVPPFKLTLDNWAEWVLVMIIVFSSYGSEGRLMIQCLRGHEYILPDQLDLDTYLKAKWSAVLDSHNIKYQKDRRVT